MQPTSPSILEIYIGDVYQEEDCPQTKFSTGDFIYLDFSSLSLSCVTHIVSVYGLHASVT